MIVLAAVVVLLASVPCTGGRVANLAQLDVRRPWLVVGGFGAQLAALSLIPAVAPALSTALHLVSYAVAGVFLVLNRHIRWIWVVAVGAASNGLAVAVNGGVMPASAHAYRVAGLATAGSEFANSRPVNGARLSMLGDVFAVPAGWPLANVFSVGDVVLVAGAGLLVHAACRSQAWSRLPPSEPGSTLHPCP